MPLSGIATIYTLRRFHMIMRRTTPVEPSEPVEPAPPLSHVIKGQHAPRAKFESRYEWLGIRDWGLGVTSDW